jgi:uncharacterized protein
MSLQEILRRHPVLGYFAITFGISWTLAFLVVSRYLLEGRTIPYLDGVLMFPLMIFGPCVSGVAMTGIVDGRAGIAVLASRMRKWRVGRWGLAILIPPVLTSVLLLALSSLVSTAFTPNAFVLGIGFGILAGYLEEIGWTGYAIRKLGARRSALASAILLGGLWGLWHAPVVDFLGAAYPHGEYWLPFYLSFICILMAVRVLIVWLYSNTRSLALAQAMHMSLTGSLAVFDPTKVTPAQEAGWYAIYAGLLWVVVLIVTTRYGRNLSRNDAGFESKVQPAATAPIPP